MCFEYFENCAISSWPQIQGMQIPIGLLSGAAKKKNMILYILVTIHVS